MGGRWGGGGGSHRGALAPFARGRNYERGRVGVVGGGDARDQGQPAAGAIRRRTVITGLPLASHCNLATWIIGLGGCVWRARNCSSEDAQRIINVSLITT